MNPSWPVRNTVAAAYMTTAVASPTVSSDHRETKTLSKACLFEEGS